MRFSMVFSFLVAMAFSSGNAVAVTINTDGGGNLTGVSGLSVGGTTYDATLVDDSCIGGFGGCDSLTDFTFNTQSDALDAMSAFLTAVAPSFTGKSDQIFGCNTTVQCILNLPFNLKPGNNFVGPSVDVALGVIVHSSGSGFIGLFPLSLQPGNWGIGVDLSANTQNVFLKFSPPDGGVAPIPLPASLPLLLAALGGLGLAGRRKLRSA